ncbi:proline iminopeptidase-family hydrolase [Microbacterium pumilum]|uniref:Proline iminopeptidase-family hydrolase n=2 Tax=Microbacterium pumilum TaxID=344165 RepID=A0ABN2SZK1_9MICO
MRATYGFLAVDRARLRVRVIGEGPTIIVLHGGPDFDHFYLLPELDRLAEKFRLVYYDQRGRGRSADGVRPKDVTLISEMGDLDAVRSDLELETVAVLGHSWGGVLAMEYATRHPERVSHLVLMNTAPASHHDAEVFRRHLRSIRPASEINAMDALAASDTFRAGALHAELDYYRLHFRPALVATDQLDRVIPRLRAHFTPERVLLARAIEQRLYRDTWSSPTYDLLPRLHHLAVPTLLLHGEHDFIPIRLAEHIAGAIPDSRFVVLPGCGHFAYMEAPELVREQVGRLFGVSAFPSPRRAADAGP